MEENYTMQQTSSSEPKKNRKRKWLRSCLIVLFGYFAISLVIVCSIGGCCTKPAVDYYRPRRAKLDDRHFEVSPDGREIVYSSVLGIYRQNFLGVYNIRSEGPHFEKRIPMDPVPDGMFLFTLEVEEDPSQEQAKSRRVRTSNWSGPVDYLFPFPLEPIGGINIFPDYYHDIWPEGTFLLKIHPDDRDKLSQPFCVRVRDTSKAHSRIKYILVFPRGKEENRYEVLTARRPSEENPIPETADKRVFELQPFEEEFYAIAKKETREDGVKGGLFLVGGAILLDIVLLPAEVLYWAGRGGFLEMLANNPV